MIKWPNLVKNTAHSKITLRYWLPTIIIVALSSLCYLLQAYDYLWDYQRSAITDGKLWRLFTGHFSHTNGYHYLLNVLAMILLNAIHGQFYRLPNFFMLWILTALTVSTGLYFTSSITQYVGLSGVLHGLFVWGALHDIQSKERTGIWLFLGIWLKVIYEQIYGADNDIVQLIDANVAIDAHLWGAIAGSCYFIVVFFFDRFTNRK